MKIPEAIKIAVRKNDTEMIEKICNQLQSQCKFRYKETFNLFHKHTGIELPEFDGLMMDIDSQGL